MPESSVCETSARARKELSPSITEKAPLGWMPKNMCYPPTTSSSSSSARRSLRSASLPLPSNYSLRPRSRSIRSSPSHR
eukprot:1373235-Pyramimonas_sp.AAC.1